MPARLALPNTMILRRSDSMIDVWCACRPFHDAAAQRPVVLFGGGGCPGCRGSGSAHGLPESVPLRRLRPRSCLPTDTGASPVFTYPVIDSGPRSCVPTDTGALAVFTRHAIDLTFSTSRLLTHRHRCACLVQPVCYRFDTLALVAAYPPTQVPLWFSLSALAMVVQLRNACNALVITEQTREFPLEAKPSFSVRAHSQVTQLTAEVHTKTQAVHAAGSSASDGLQLLPGQVPEYTVCTKSGL